MKKLLTVIEEQDSVRPLLAIYLKRLKQADNAHTQILAQLIEPVAKSVDPDLGDLTRYIHKVSHELANEKTNQPSKPKYFETFRTKFEQLQPEIKVVVQKNLKRWEADPWSFWGWVDLSQPAPSSLFGAARRLDDYIDRSEEDPVVSPMRRRLCLIALSNLRETVRGRVECLAQDFGKLEKGMTYKSISDNIVCKLVNKPGSKKKCLARLRAGERYSRFPAGAPLVLGHVPSDSMWVLCHSSATRLLMP